MNLSIKPNSRFLDYMCEPAFRNQSYADFATAQAERLIPIIEAIASLRAQVFLEVSELTDDQLASWKSNITNNVNRLYRQVIADMQLVPDQFKILSNTGYIIGDEFIKMSAYTGLVSQGTLDPDTDTFNWPVTQEKSFNDLNKPHWTDPFQAYEDILHNFKDGIFNLRASAAAARTATINNIQDRISKYEAELSSVLDISSSNVKTAYTYYRNAIISNEDGAGIMNSIFNVLGGNEALEAIVSDSATVDSSKLMNLVSDMPGYTGVSPASACGSGVLSKVVTTTIYGIFGAMCLLGRAMEWCYKKVKGAVNYVKEVYSDPVDIETTGASLTFGAAPSVDNAVISNMILNTQTNTITTPRIPQGGSVPSGYRGRSGLVYDWWIGVTEGGVTSAYHYYGSPTLYKWALMFYKHGLISHDPSTADTQDEKYAVEVDMFNLLNAYSTTPFFYKCTFGEVSLKYDEGLWWEPGSQLDEYFKVYSTYDDWTQQNYKEVPGRIRYMPTMSIAIKPYLVTFDYFWAWLEATMTRTDITGAALTYQFDGSNASWLLHSYSIKNLNESYPNKYLTKINTEKEAYISGYFGYVGLYLTLLLGFDALEGDDVKCGITFKGIDPSQVAVGSEAAYVLNYFNDHAPSVITNADFVSLFGGYVVDGNSRRFNSVEFNANDAQSGCSLVQYDGRVASNMNDISTLPEVIYPIFKSVREYAITNNDNNLWIPFRDKNIDFSPSMFRIKTDSENVNRAVIFSTILVAAAAALVAAVTITAACWYISSTLFTKRESFSISMWNKMSRGEDLSGFEKFKYWRYSKGVNIVSSTLDGIVAPTSNLYASLNNNSSGVNTAEQSSYENYISLYKLIRG